MPIDQPPHQRLHVQDWPLPFTGREGARATVILVHGLGEHIGRYAHVAQRLNDWGFDVRGYDHYGHGRSQGARGTLPSLTTLLDDLAWVVDDTRQKMALEAASPTGGNERRQRLILLGHSMGGSVVARFVVLKVRAVQGLVMSSPALAVDLSGFQKCLLGAIPFLAPNLCVHNGLQPQFISHDAAVVQAYVNDALNHNRISGRLGKFIADTGAPTMAAAAQWTLPTLLMFAGQDKLVASAGSRAFAAAAPASIVRSQEFADHYHEIFNEDAARAQPVFALLQQWLEANFG